MCKCILCRVSGILCTFSKKYPRLFYFVPLIVGLVVANLVWYLFFLVSHP